jgi:prolyl oligopeptidase
MMLKLMNGLFALVIAVLALPWSNAVAQEDPFLWLESPTDPAALKWASEQTEQTKKELSSLPEYPAVSAELKQSLSSAPSTPSIFFEGRHLLRFTKDVAHPYGLLEVADRGANGLPGAWRTVLDVNALRASEKKPYELQYFGFGTRCAPPDYDRCLLGISLGGADDGELREFRLSTGKFVEDGFHTLPGRNHFAWLDANTVLISSSTFHDSLTAAGFSDAVHLWRRGTSLSAAPVIWHGEPTDQMLNVYSVGATNFRQGVIERVVDFSHFRSYIVAPGQAARVVELPFGVTWLLGTTERHIIFETTQPAVIRGVSAPANTIVAYDSDPSTPQHRRLSIVYAPHPGENVISDASVPQISITRSTVNFIVSRHLIQRPMSGRFEKDHWTLERGDVQPVGTTIGYEAADKASDDYLRLTTGFLVPKRYDYVHDGTRIETLFQEQPLFDASGYLVEVRTAVSRDGTPIDYYLLRPKKITPPGETPTLITGYGAFNVTFQPDYLGPDEGGRSFLSWLSRGGALALASIRGGGDRGAEWHEAAMGVNRQRSYDDFLAVTADLEHGFTTRNHMGVFGSSNGGLLAATVAIERPDLYGAAISDVPLTDILRLPYMGIGAAWLNEYGDPKDSAGRAAILRYSPYQNVREGVKYPPFMITSSTEDNRVGPGHARKLAARLEAVGSTVYLYENQEGGHGVSDPLERPELISLRMALLIHRLMSPSPGHKD